MFKYFKIALRNVLANKRRTLFITIAIAIGSTIIIMANSLSNGVRENMVKNVFAMFTGHVNVYGVERIRGQELYRISNSDKIVDVIQSQCPDANIVHRTQIPGQMANPNKSVNFQNTVMLGMDLEKEKLLKDVVNMTDCDILPKSLSKNEMANVQDNLTEETDKAFVSSNYTLDNATSSYALNLQSDTNVDELIKTLKKGKHGIEKEKCGSLDSASQIDYAVIDSDTASKFELKVGDKFTFEGPIETPDLGVVNNSVDLIVGGIYQGWGQMGFFTMFITSKETANKFLMVDEQYVSNLALYFPNKEDSIESADKIEEGLLEISDDENFKVKEKDRSDSDSSMSSMEKTTQEIEERLKEKEDGLTINVTTWQEEISFLEQMVSTINYLFYIVIGILMVIILFGISNTLIMSIRERTGEVGTLRAIGMQKPSVMVMFLLEGMLLGLFGSLLGVVIGGSLSLLFTIKGIYIGPSPISVFLVDNTLFFKLTFGTILFNVLFITGASMIASIYPSYKATKLKPITAMHKD